MPLTLRDIPPDSILQCFCSYLNVTEVPFMFQLAAGLSLVGLACRRSRWIDQFDWRVYPNQSVMFIGPSGLGKDTIINRVVRSVNSIQHITHVPVIGGVTMEGIHARLVDLGKVSAAFIPAPEITAFFGKADYQANMLTGITNLLSNSESIDVTTKGSYTSGHKQLIQAPTITMHCGSTVEWLHKGMPDGTLEGGFLGRFLIIVEEIGAKYVPLVKQYMTQEVQSTLRVALAAWQEGLEEIARRCGKSREVIIYTEAEDLYVNWYHNRFKQFSKAVMPYANRSRDTVLRLAMLVALSRFHDRWIEEADMDLAIRIIADVAEKIDRVVLPPSPEAQVAEKLVEILPASIGEIYSTFGMRYSIPKQIDPALDLLKKSNRIKFGRDGIVTLVEKID